MTTTLLEQFVLELGQFALEAETVLQEIQSDLEGKKGRFGVFYEQMIAIRGTAQQLEFTHIAKLAGLAEELALKAQGASQRAHLRKAAASLWDATTTLKFLVQNPTLPTNEEQEILAHRLEANLNALGGAAQKVDASEIEALLAARK